MVEFIVVEEGILVMVTYLSSIEEYDPVQNKWSVSAGNFPEKKDFRQMQLYLNGRVYVVAGTTRLNARRLQQSLRRRPERLRGGRLRLVPQGRRCTSAGNTPLVQAEDAGWIGDDLQARCNDS